MINVLLLGSSLHVGGAERVIANLAGNVDRKRFSVTVCHLKERGMLGDQLAAQGFDVIGLPQGSGRVGRYLSFRALAELVRAKVIDVVHTHTTYGLTDASLCKLLLCRRTKLIHTFHFGNYPFYPRRYQLLEAVHARVADRLVAVGVEQREKLLATYGLQGRRVSTVLNGVNLPNSELNAEWSLRLRGTGKIVVGSICTFIEQKGLPDLLAVAIAVCRSFDNVVFVLVGNGPLRGKLMRDCEEAGLSDRVLFPGWIQDAGSAILPAFDVFIQTSRWEAMSMVVLEAMAAAKPVVVTDVGDNRHVVLDGKTGMVVPAGSQRGLEVALVQLLSSVERRNAFGAAGLQRYLEHYTVQMMTQSYERLYTECLDLHNS